MPQGERQAFKHLLADFNGVPPARLRDRSFIGGLLVAAAGAAGLTSVAVPVLKEVSGGGVAAFLLVDGCHIAVHAFPQRQLLMLDLLAGEAVDTTKALDVFARRLGASAVISNTHLRGG